MSTESVSPQEIRGLLNLCRGFETEVQPSLLEQKVTEAAQGALPQQIADQYRGTFSIAFTGKDLNVANVEVRRTKEKRKWYTIVADWFRAKRTYVTDVQIRTIYTKVQAAIAQLEQQAPPSPRKKPGRGETELPKLKRLREILKALLPKEKESVDAAASGVGSEIPVSPAESPKPELDEKEETGGPAAAAMSTGNTPIKPQRPVSADDLAAKARNLKNPTDRPSGEPSRPKTEHARACSDGENSVLGDPIVLEEEGDKRKGITITDEMKKKGVEERLRALADRVTQLGDDEQLSRILKDVQALMPEVQVGIDETVAVSVLARRGGVTGGGDGDEDEEEEEFDDWDSPSPKKDTEAVREVSEEDKKQEVVEQLQGFAAALKRLTVSQSQGGETEQTKVDRLKAVIGKLRKKSALVRALYPEAELTEIQETEAEKRKREEQAAKELHEKQVAARLEGESQRTVAACDRGIEDARKLIEKAKSNAFLRTEEEFTVWIADWEAMKTGYGKAKTVKEKVSLVREFAKTTRNNKFIRWDRTKHQQWPTIDGIIKALEAAVGIQAGTPAVGPAEEAAAPSAAAVDRRLGQIHGSLEAVNQKKDEALSALATAAGSRPTVEGLVQTMQAAGQAAERLMGEAEKAAKSSPRDAGAIQNLLKSFDQSMKEAQGARGSIGQQGTEIDGLLKKARQVLEQMRTQRESARKWLEALKREKKEGVPAAEQEYGSIDAAIEQVDKRLNEVNTAWLPSHQALSSVDREIQTLQLRRAEAAKKPAAVEKPPGKPSAQPGRKATGGRPLPTPLAGASDKPQVKAAEPAVEPPAAKDTKSEFKQNVQLTIKCLDAAKQVKVQGAYDDTSARGLLTSLTTAATVEEQRKLIGQARGALTALLQAVGETSVRGTNISSALESLGEAEQLLPPKLAEEGKGEEAKRAEEVAAQQARAAEEAKRKEVEQAVRGQVNEVQRSLDELEPSIARVKQQEEEYRQVVQEAGKKQQEAETAHKAATGATATATEQKTVERAEAAVVAWEAFQRAALATQQEVGRAAAVAEAFVEAASQALAAAKKSLQQADTAVKAAEGVGREAVLLAAAQQRRARSIESEAKKMVDRAQAIAGGQAETQKRAAERVAEAKGQVETIQAQRQAAEERAAAERQERERQEKEAAEAEAKKRAEEQAAAEAARVRKQVVEAAQQLANDAALFLTTIPGDERWRQATGAAASVQQQMKEVERSAAAATAAASTADEAARAARTVGAAEAAAQQAQQAIALLQQGQPSLTAVGEQVQKAQEAIRALAEESEKIEQEIGELERKIQEKQASTADIAEAKELMGRAQEAIHSGRSRVQEGRRVLEAARGQVQAAAQGVQQVQSQVAAAVTTAQQAQQAAAAARAQAEKEEQARTAAAKAAQADEAAERARQAAAPSIVEAQKTYGSGQEAAGSVGRVLGEMKREIGRAREALEKATGSQEVTDAEAAEQRALEASKKAAEWATKEKERATALAAAGHLAAAKPLAAAFWQAALAAVQAAQDAQRAAEGTEGQKLQEERLRAATARADEGRDMVQKLDGMERTLQDIVGRWSEADGMKREVAGLLTAAQAVVSSAKARREAEEAQRAQERERVIAAAVGATPAAEKEAAALLRPDDRLLTETQRSQLQVKGILRKQEGLTVWQQMGSYINSEQFDLKEGPYVVAEKFNEHDFMKQVLEARNPIAMLFICDIVQREHPRKFTKPTDLEAQLARRFVEGLEQQPADPRYQQVVDYMVENETSVFREFYKKILDEIAVVRAVKDLAQGETKQAVAEMMKERNKDNARALIGLIISQCPEGQEPALLSFVHTLVKKKVMDRQEAIETLVQALEKRGKKLGDAFAKTFVTKEHAASEFYTALRTRLKEKLPTVEQQISRLEEQQAPKKTGGEEVEIVDVEPPPS